MRRLFCAVVLIGGLFVSTFELHAGETAAAAKVDLAYVPADAIAAVLVRPQRAIHSPQFEFMPSEIISAMGKKEAGFDPLEIESALVVSTLPQMAGPQAAPAAPVGAPNFALVVRFTQPQNVGRVLQTIIKDGRDDQIHGKTARIAAQAAHIGPSILAVDDRTFIFAQETSFEWILANGGGESPLRQRLAALGPNCDAAVLLDVEPLRPLLVPFLGMMAPQVPPEFRGLLQLPALTDFAELQITDINLPTSQVELDLAAKNEGTADQIKNLLQQGMQTAVGAFLAQFDAEAKRRPGDREVEEATKRYMTRISDKLMRLFEPKTKDNHVLIATPFPQGGSAEAGVLVALLLPATQAAREAANRNLSQNNLKQIGLGLLNYEDVHHKLPARASFSKDGKPLLSWRVLILPLLEENALYAQFHLDEPWDSEHNKALVEKMPAVYKHPKFDAPGMTVYQAVVGKGFGFEGDEGLKLASFTDGTSKTVLVVETSPDKAVPWTKPEDFEPDENNILSGLGGLFSGGIFNCVFCDGHVDGITDGIDPNALRAMFTRNGGEVNR